MATFEKHIEGLTQIDITTTSAPTIDELTEILKEGLINTVNAITTLKPEELPKFTKTTNSTGSSNAAVNKRGKILSVLREHDSTSILRICTPINPSLRYEATDVDSLHYRSKYNPGYYELNNSIYTVPQASSTNNNRIVVNQIHYDTGLVATDNYNATAVENFPLEYEYLLGLYGAAMACNVAANNIHNNMPTNPVSPLSPDFTVESVTLPTLPTFIPPKLSVTFNSMTSAISREDFDLADKYMTLFDKRISSYEKEYEQENTHFQKELEVFKSDLDKLIKDSDRKTQIEATEYKSELEKYTAELNFFQADLQEKITQYKWYTSQYASFMQQYSAGIGVQYRPQKQQQERRGEE